MDTLHTQVIQEYCSMNWNAVIAYATTAYVLVSIIILCLTRWYYNRTTRPFISIDIKSVNITEAMVKPDNVHHITFAIINSGNIPAKNISIICTGTVTELGNSKSTPLSESLLNVTDLAIFPNLPQPGIIDIKKEEFLQSTCSPFYTFEISYQVRYEGVRHKTYTTNLYYCYDRALKVFVPTSCHWS